MRKIFEEILQKNLLNYDFGKYVKIKKNKLSIKTENGEGELCFVFSNKGSGYYIVGYAENHELRQFVNSINPPYKSRILAKQMFCFSSLCEESPAPLILKQGLIPLPSDMKKAEELIKKVIVLIESKYLFRIKNLIFNTPELVADIIKYPDTYTYPFITVLFVIRNTISENLRESLKKMIIDNQKQLLKYEKKEKIYDLDILLKI